MQYGLAYAPLQIMREKGYFAQQAPRERDKMGLNSATLRLFAKRFFQVKLISDSWGFPPF